MGLKDSIKKNLQEMVNPSKGSRLNAVARIGTPLALQTAHYFGSDLPSEKAYALGGAGASLAGNALLWRAPTWAQIAGHTGLYALTRMGAKHALREEDRRLKESIAKKLVQENPTYKRFKTRVRNLEEELEQ